MWLWAAWFCGRCPCLWQGAETRWFLRCFPTQAILWFYICRSYHSVNSTSYYFPWKLQQMEREPQHYLIEQILSYIKWSFSAVTTISYSFSPMMNKSLHATLAKTCTSGGHSLSFLPLLKLTTHHLTVLTSTAWCP